MSQYKICVYAICKNEEKFINRWMDSVSEADLVVVLDTGSTDKSVEKLRSRGALVYTEIINPWRFDTARNKAMDFIPTDVDICVSNDIDEVFEPGWRKRLEDKWDPSYTRANYLFTWSYRPDGTPAKQFTMGKIHRRHNFRWVHPVHEVLAYNGTNADKSVWIDGLVLNHYPDSSKPRSQYLPLLELSAKENPQDDRTMFWLGREYMYYGKYDLCIKTLKNHLSLPSAKWAEERSASMRFIGSAYESKGNMPKAKAWLFRAVAECPGIREPYLKLAKIGYSEKNWPLTYAMVKNGLYITQPSGSYLVEPESWGYSFYDLGAISAYRLGIYKESLEFARRAIELNNTNERLKVNLRLIENKISKLSDKGGLLNEQL